MRLFVAVWPSEEVVAALRDLPRPDGVRWTTEEQWHVTLRFLGRVDDAGPVIDALGTVEHWPPPLTAGPATKHLGPGALVVPVRGVDDLVHAVHAATEDVVPITEHRPFRGHLTVARAHHKGQIPRSLDGVPFEVSWTPTSFALVRSQTKQSGAVYDDVATFPLR